MKLKKLLSAVIACFLMFSTPLLPCENLPIKIQAGAEEEYMPEDYNGLFYYKKYSDHIEIIGTVDKESLATLEIPSEIDRLPVTVIGNMAFYECMSLTSVTIPENVTYIGAFAFCRCKNLSSVTIPESVTYIGANSFHNTEWIAERRKENPLVIINDILVEGREYQEDVLIIPDNIKSVSDGAFDHHEKLTSVTIPESVTYVGDCAFSCCEKLISITIPESLTYIGGGAFGYTPWMTEKQKENPLVIVNNILIDGIKCKGDVVIPDNVTDISGEVFSTNPHLTSVTIPDSVKTIGRSAFSSCKSLTSLTVPESVTYIGMGAFAHCDGLTSLIIKNPECELSEMFYSAEWIKKPDSLVVYGYDESTAQTCAEENGFRFKILVDSSENVLYGDANDDKKVSISDAVAILQNISNLQKYPLSHQGKINADVDGEAGITGKDAAAIQMYDAGVLTELPVR